MSEVVVSVGATGVLFGVMQSVVSEGDQVIVLEPAFDCYGPQASLAGATVVASPLLLKSSFAANGGTYEIDFADLASKVNDRTRVIVLNTVCT
jgi:aspartate/methionine/tyrosine aminotransferase